MSVAQFSQKRAGETAVLLWIGYAAAAALLLSLSPVFMKAGAKRTAPAVGALLFSFVALIASIGVLFLQGTVPSPAAFSLRTILLLSLAGLMNGCMWLCQFRALAGAPVNRVQPVVHVSSLLLLLGNILFFETRIWLWRACYILLVLIGTVLMESRPQRARSALWLLYAGFAAVFSALSDLICRLGAPDMAFSVTTAARAAVSFVFLLIVAAAGRSFGMLRQMGVSGWCFTLLAGLTAGGAWICRFYSECYGDWDSLLPVTCLVLPLSLLFSRICLKERMPGAAVLGLVLAALGNFALLMNF